MWNLESAILNINALRNHHTGYFYGLTGGVLYRGHSLHDLDIACVSIAGRDNTDELLRVAREKMGWTLVSSWPYTQHVMVYKHTDEIGRVVELWVNACNPGRYTLLQRISKLVKAAARRVRYFLRGYK